MKNRRESPPLEAGRSPAKTAMSSEEAEKARALVDESIERHRLHLENASGLLDKILKAHENGASFYEKLILFDVGTIALSLTLLGQILAHTPDGHVPRHPFLWFLSPAWFLLLVSIQCCALRLADFHNTSLVLIQQMSAWFSDNHVHKLSSLLTRLSALIGQVVLSEEQTQHLQFANATHQGNSEHKAQSVSEVFANMNETLVRAAKDQTSEISALLQKATQSNKRTSIAARIGVFATMVALLLICIFAIKAILSI
jgi:hypothetical protein